MTKTIPPRAEYTTVNGIGAIVIGISVLSNVCVLVLVLSNIGVLVFSNVGILVLSKVGVFVLSNVGVNSVTS